MTTTFEQFTNTREVIGLDELADRIGSDMEMIYEPSEDVKQVHVYMGAAYILELWSGLYWTIVDRTDWTRPSLKLIEREFYDALIDDGII